MLIHHEGSWGGGRGGRPNHHKCTHPAVGPRHHQGSLAATSAGAGLGHRHPGDTVQAAASSAFLEGNLSLGGPAQRLAGTEPAGFCWRMGPLPYCGLKSELRPTQLVQPAAEKSPRALHKKCRYASLRRLFNRRLLNPPDNRGIGPVIRTILFAFRGGWLLDQAPFCKQSKIRLF